MHDQTIVFGKLDRVMGDDAGLLRSNTASLVGSHAEANSSSRCRVMGPMASEKLDIVVPTLGQKPSLSATVSSLLKQDHVNKVIVVATGGEAQSAHVGHVESFERTTVVRVQGLLPAGAARNLGVERSMAEYVGFCDDDDVWVQGTSNQLIDCAVSGGVAVGALHLLDRSGGCISVCPGRNQIRRNNIHIWNPGLTGSNVILSRDLFDRVGGWPGALRRYNDIGLLIRLANLGPIPVVRAARVLVDISDHNRIGKVLRQSAESAEGLISECSQNDGPAALRREASVHAARFRGQLWRHLASEPMDVPAAVRVAWYAGRRRIPIGLLGRGCGRDHSGEFARAVS